MITNFKCRCGRTHAATDNCKHVVCVCGQFIDVAECATWYDESGPINPELWDNEQDLIGGANVVTLTRTKAHACGATTHADGTVMCQQCGLSWDKDDTPPDCPNK